MSNVQFLQTDNCYQLLGVLQSASLNEIRDAYERKLEEVHEESLAAYSLCPEDVNEQRLLNLSLAFMKLADPEARSQYDRELNALRKKSGQPRVRGASASTGDFSEGTSWSSRDRKVVYLRPRNQGGGFSTSSGVQIQPEPLVADLNQNPSALQRNTVQASLEELTNQSAQMRQNAFRQLVEKNERAEKKLESYYEKQDTGDAQDRYCGGALKKIRELKEIDLADLATVTCVRQIYLKAIENENIDVFPSGIYLKGYLQCYAKALDLPVEEVTEHYMRRFDF